LCPFAQTRSACRVDSGWVIRAAGKGDALLRETRRVRGERGENMFDVVARLRPVKYPWHVLTRRDLR
jgi:hypothetical protein